MIDQIILIESINRVYSSIQCTHIVLFLLFLVIRPLIHVEFTVDPKCVKSLSVCIIPVTLIELIKVHKLVKRVWSCLLNCSLLAPYSIQNSQQTPKALSVCACIHVSHCGVLQDTVVYCKTLLCIAAHCCVLQHYRVLQHIAACSVLQCVLQCVVLRCRTRQCASRTPFMSSHHHHRDFNTLPNAATNNISKQSYQQEHLGECDTGERIVI